VFRGCYNLKTINLPDTLTTIQGAAFWKCSSLNNVTLPEGLKEIGAAAFCECTSLESITIPKSTTIVDYMSFNGCIAMRDFTVLNPSCTLNDPFEQAPKDKADQIRMDYIWDVPAYNHYKLTVHGYAGSTAEAYAKATNKPFTVIENEPQATDFLSTLRAAFNNLLAMLKPMLDNLMSALKGLFGSVSVNPQQPADPAQPTQPAQPSDPAQPASEAGQAFDFNALLNRLMPLVSDFFARFQLNKGTADNAA